MISQLQAACGRHGLMFRVTPVLLEQDPFGHIPLDLPAIRGVRLLDVDDEERDSVTVAARDVLQVPNLGPEGGSRIAPEDEADWLLSPEAGQAHAGISPELFERKVRRIGAHLRAPSHPVRPPPPGLRGGPGTPCYCRRRAPGAPLSRPSAR